MTPRFVASALPQARALARATVAGAASASLAASSSSDGPRSGSSSSRRGRHRRQLSDSGLNFGGWRSWASIRAVSMVLAMCGGSVRVGQHTSL